MSNGKPLLPQWAILAVIGTVMFVWVVNMGYAMINPKWEVPAAVHGIAGMAITSVLGLLAVSRARTNGG